MSKYSFLNYLLLIFCFLLISCNIAHANSYKKQNLLLISSYHPNFPTFFQQIDGLRSELNNKKFNLDVEFMDSKRFPGIDAENKFYDYLSDKIKKLPPYNLIFTSDDNALNFIIKYHKKLFPKIPIVFFGVNNLKNAELQNQNKLITGIVEATSIAETINLAKEIIPNLKNVIAISDSTTSGSSDLISFISYQNSFPGLNLSALSLAELSWEELINNLKDLNSNSCLLLLSAYRDKNNKSMLFPESLYLIISNSPVPVFHLWEHGLGDGIIGGKLVSHFEQGKQAGVIAQKILSGENINNIQVQSISPNKTILDYNVVKEFDLSLDNVSDNISFINKPFSIFNKYKWVLYPTGSAFIIMFISIFLLIINIHRKKIIEEKLRKSEQTFRTLFNESSHFIGLLSLDFKLTRANIPALNAIGLKGSDVYNQLFWDTPWWVGTGYEKKLQNSLKRAAKGEKVRFIATHNFFDGKEIIVDFSAKPVYNDNNTVTEILVEGLDITETRRIEDQLKHVEKMNSIGTLAGGLAHDFNNMLGGVIGCAEALQKFYENNSAANNLINMIIESSEKAAKLIKNLLAFSRKQQMFPSPITVHKIIADSIMLLAHTVDKRIQIESDLSAESSTIIGDKSQIQNIFLNLGINAWHAMPNGGKLFFKTNLITFDADYCTASPFNLSPGDYLQIDVNDDGKGIEHDHLQHIFDPFYTTKKIGKGTGLGLSAAYGTVIQHLGAITVDSELGNGTTFHVYFPLTRELEPENHDIIQNLSSQKGEILIADDEKVMRFTAKIILESIGCNVTLANDGKEAFEIFSETPNKFDVIILDIVMPKLNGIDCLTKIHKVNPEACIIISSGYSSETYTKKIKKDDIFGFINKPYRAEELRDIISKALSANSNN